MLEEAVMNKYVNLSRIEFSITDACTGRCRHCSAGGGIGASGKFIDKGKATELVLELAGTYSIGSVMTFGGEPLLGADAVCAIHKAAAGCGVPKRQVITNGYFTKDRNQMAMVASALKESGVNSLLLSVDAFHKEHIPPDQVHYFAECLCRAGIEGFYLHPAWVVSRKHENRYNRETEACLQYFTDLDIPVSSGNDIFPAGSAAVNLSEYYDRKALDLSVKCGEAPYSTRLDHVDAISVNPNGDLMVCCFTAGNIHHESAVEILGRYDPYGNPFMKILLESGVSGLLDKAACDGIHVDLARHYSACGVCRELMKRMAPA
jgi:hypothetical protein